MVIDLSFFGANLAKILDGGWYPIVLGVAVYIAMETWTMGQAFIASRVDAMVEPLEDFLARIDKKKIPRVSGTAVYLSEGLARAPLAFVHNVSHNKVIHERVIFVSVEFTQTPYVRSDDRVEIFPLSDRYHRVLVRFGFMDNPNLRAALRILPNRGIDLDIDKTTFFVGRRSLVASRTFGLSYWRDRIYLYMARNAQWIIDYFNLPPDRVFEIGAQIKF
jgi:KUP system potassium uptake protein